MKFSIKFLIILLFTSCDNNISGVIIENSNYNKKINLILDGYENKDLELLEKFTDNQVKSTYSTNILFGKESLLNTWLNDFYYFNSIKLKKREIYTVFNNDKTFSTVLKSDWYAIGNFSGNKVSIPSYYEFIWRNDKIIKINTYFDNFLYVNEIKSSYDE